MMLRYSLDMPDEAVAIESAVCKAIESGVRTLDINGKASTQDFGDAVARLLMENDE